MRSWIDVWWMWRRRAWIWAPALLFFVANLVSFSAYRLVYVDRVDLLEQRIEAEQERLADLGERARRLEDALERAVRTREEVERLYREGFSTERRRLTTIIDEVKRLASRAGLVPDAITYPEEQIQDFGLVRKSFVFSVEGSYVDLRKLINFLELSESFLTLEEIGLSEADARRGRLRINLRLSTHFVAEGARS